MYANYLVERSSCLESSGWGNLPRNLTGDKQMHIQLCSNYITLHDFEYIYVASWKHVIISAVRSSIEEFGREFS